MTHSRVPAEGRSQDPGPDGGHHQTTGARKWRSPLAGLLVLLGCLVAPVAVVAAWANSEVSDTGRYVETVTPLADDPAIQDAVAASVTREIGDNLDIDGVSRQAAESITSGPQLPPEAAARLRSLVGAMPIAFESLVEEQVRNVVRSNEFRHLWIEANRTTHTTMVDALSGASGTIVVENSVVSLDLSPFLDAAKQQLHELGFTAVDTLPPLDPSIELARNQDLVKVQAAYDWLNRLSTILPFLALVLIGSGVLLAKSHRRAVVGAGLGLALAMVLLGLGVLVARGIYLGSIPSDALPAEAAGALFDTMVRFLAEKLGTFAVLGLVVAAGAFMVGPAGVATGIRSDLAGAIGGVRTRAGSAGVHAGPLGLWMRTHAKVLRELAVLGAGVALLFWDRPTAGTVFLLAALVLLVLAVIELLGGGDDAAPAEPGGSAHDADDADDAGDADTDEAGGRATRTHLGG